MRRDEQQGCAHCGGPIPSRATTARYCCQGCEAVAALLEKQDLGRYYQLAGNRVQPVAADESPRSHAWLEAALGSALAQPEAVKNLCLDVQGLHCAACVWLLNETFRRRKVSGTVLVNPTLGTVQLQWQGSFDPLDWVKDVERYGYRFGPARKRSTSSDLEVPWRLGVCAAITINVMLFSVSFYFGLSPSEPEVFTLFTGLSFVLSSVSVAVGGWPFVRAAIRGLRSGILHLDLPIALGIALVYIASIAQLFSRGRGDLAYLDTLNTFITLMLLGRFLQERFLERSRRFLLEDDGAERIVTRRLIGSKVEAVAAPRIELGDQLIIAPGELVPVDATLIDATASVRTDWMTGEPDPLQFEAGATVKAGSFNAGHHAFHVWARQPFSESPLVSLLRQPRPRDVRRATHQQLWDGLAKRWVVTVLAVASVGFLFWLPHDADRAIDVAVSLLVITCPCAIGIAIPLAYELVQSRLRAQGFYVRESDLLDRLTTVRRVAFDKTGTLTMRRLGLTPRSNAELAQLGPLERTIAWNLAVRSNHPVSDVIAQALKQWNPSYQPAAAITEVPGQGMAWHRGDGLWRLGRGAWTGTRDGTHLSRDGVTLATFETTEALRPDTEAEIAELTAKGYELWLLSGDEPRKVKTLAQTLGVPIQRALGGLSPEDKAQFVSTIGADQTLYVGDGVNDALAFSAALAAGTPAADRPVMPSRSDFFLIGEGLAPLRQALDESHRLRRVIRRMLALSFTYNLVAIAVALAGAMSPVVAAVSMPASTLTLLLFTVSSLRPQPSDGPRHANGPGMNRLLHKERAEAARPPSTMQELQQ